MSSSVQQVSETVPDKTETEKIMEQIPEYFKENKNDATTESDDGHTAFQVRRSCFRGMSKYYKARFSKYNNQW